LGESQVGRGRMSNYVKKINNPDKEEEEVTKSQESLAESVASF